MAPPQTPPPEKLVPTPQTPKPRDTPCSLHLNRSFFIRYLLIRSNVHLSLSHKVVFQSSEDGHFQPVPARWPICHILRAQREQQVLLPPLLSLIALCHTQKYTGNTWMYFICSKQKLFLSAQSKNEIKKKRIELNLWVAKNCFIGFNTRLEQNRSYGEIEIRHV